MDMVARARRGDQVALERLYAQHATLLRFLAGQYFGGHGLDEADLAQEARIGFWKAIRDYREDRGTTFASFARMCVERQLITALKTATRGKHRVLSGAARLESPLSDGEGETLADRLPSLALDPVDRLIEGERMREIFHAILHDLSDLERISVEGVAIQGRSYERLAEEQDVEVKQIDNALQRARRKINGKPAHSSYSRPGIAQEMARSLGPFERSVYATGVEFGWDPAVIAEELGGANRTIGESGKISGGERVDVGDVVISIARIRKTLGSLTSRPPEPPSTRRPRRAVEYLYPSTGVTPTAEPVPPPREEQDMSDENVVEEPRGGFADSIEKMAQEESQRVLDELVRLRFDARQVARVMRGMGLNVPRLVAVVADSTEPDVEVTLGVAIGEIRIGEVAEGEEFPPTEGAEDTGAKGSVPASDDVLLPRARLVEPDRRAPQPAPGEPVAKKKPTAKTPTAPTSGAAKTRAAGEANRQKVIDGIVAAGKTGIRLGDLIEKIGFNQSTTSRHIRILIADGLVHQPGGQGSEYVAASAPPTQAPETPEPKQPEPDEGTIIKAVRDLVVKGIAPFTAQDVVRALRPHPHLASLTSAQVHHALLGLEGKGTIRLNDGGMYVYVKPTDEGDAARRDRETHKALAKQEAGVGSPLAGGVPVNGTGSSRISANSDVRELVRIAEQCGATARKADGKGGHILVTFEGNQVSIASTPSFAGLRDDRAKLRRIGLAV